MTAVAASLRPSLRSRMAEAYGSAAIFALESWAEAATSVEHMAPGEREHGPSAAYGRAVLRREFWQDEAERCERIAAALGAMA